MPSFQIQKTVICHNCHLSFHFFAFFHRERFPFRKSFCIFASSMPTLRRAGSGTTYWNKRH